MNSYHTTSLHCLLLRIEEEHGTVASLGTLREQVCYTEYPLADDVRVLLKKFLRPRCSVKSVRPFIFSNKTKTTYCGSASDKSDINYMNHTITREIPTRGSLKCRFEVTCITFRYDGKDIHAVSPRAVQYTPREEQALFIYKIPLDGNVIALVKGYYYATCVVDTALLANIHAINRLKTKVTTYVALNSHSDASKINLSCEEESTLNKFAGVGV